MVAVTLLVVVSALGLGLGWLAGAPPVQTVLGLVIPAAVMVGYFLSVRARVGGGEDRPTVRVLAEPRDPTDLELERARSRALTDLLAAAGHQLPVHPERCSLRAEALAVAVEYRSVAREMKVVVPDLVVVTDPYLLRLGIHLLLDNAIRHGGPRVAIWATSVDGRFSVTVSDDGDGLPPELEDRVLQHLVDLAEPHTGLAPVRSGLALARTIAERLGGEVSYLRERTWTHFGIALPLKPAPARLAAALTRERAGVT